MYDESTGRIFVVALYIGLAVLIAVAACAGGAIGYAIARKLGG